MKVKLKQKIKILCNPLKNISQFCRKRFYLKEFKQLFKERDRKMKWREANKKRKRLSNQNRLKKKKTQRIQNK